MNAVYFSRLINTINNIRRQYRHLPRKKRMFLVIRGVESEIRVINTRTGRTENIYWYGNGNNVPFTVHMVGEK